MSHYNEMLCLELWRWANQLYFDLNDHYSTTLSPELVCFIVLHSTGKYPRGGVERFLFLMYYSSVLCSSSSVLSAC